MKKFLKKIYQLYKKKEEIYNYLIIGVLTTLVNIICKLILQNSILDPRNPRELQICVIISWIIAVIFAYITNRKIVFKSKSSKVLKEFISFIEARIVTLLIEMIFMWFFVTFLKLNTKYWVLIFNITSQFLVIVLNYILSKIFVFKKSKDRVEFL